MNGEETRRSGPDPTSLTTAALEREVDVLEQKIEAVTELLASKIEETRRYYDSILEERDHRYNEHLAANQRAVEAAFAAAEKAVVAAFEAREKAIAAAFEASEKAVAAAFESADKAITKAEISIEKRADATYVALGELQRLLGGLMPRTEAEGRFTAALDTLSELRKTYADSTFALAERVKGLESAKAGKAESQFDMRAWMMALVGIIAVAVTIAVAFGGNGT